MNYINVSAELLRLAREPTNLNYGEILLLALIKNLSENDKCFMSNESIAELLATSIRPVKRWLAHLRELELIDTYYENIMGRETRIIVPTFAK